MHSIYVCGVKISSSCCSGNGISLMQDGDDVGYNYNIDIDSDGHRFYEYDGW